MSIKASSVIKGMATASLLIAVDAIAASTLSAGGGQGRKLACDVILAVVIGAFDSVNFASTPAWRGKCE
ncbi:hypothetical protein [Stenotrophomonas ginsengisoli]|uniref:hypothetical protein n=1 Tax=Stenotrophomonas ginsengisoli TaxID=336566 RepID=UPI00128F02BA|nr:hypothetical protein [Stenotrophomonas ginsengisoli]